MEESIKYFRMASDNVEDHSQMMLGMIFLSQGNYPEAARYLKMSADNGNPVARSRYKMLMKKGGEKISAHGKK